MKSKCENNILVTSSFGYVASDLIPRLKESEQVWGLDILPSLNTDLMVEIGDENNGMLFENQKLDEAIIVHLAAARFDFDVCF